MSLSSRICGFTAWVNLRLQHSDLMLSNVLMDLMSGMYMRNLIESLTGSEFKNLGDTFDRLTQQQKVTRSEWVVKELKRWRIVPDSYQMDFKLFAARNSEEVFELLWELVSHDIWFLWERMEFLQHPEAAVLTQCVFTWIPDPIDVTKQKKKFKVTKNVLGGFGASSMKSQMLKEAGANAEVSDQPDDYEPFPGSELMKKYKSRAAPGAKIPKALDCMFQIVKGHLRMTPEGRALRLWKLGDLADTRVICALGNALFPNQFNSEVLLNDRWSLDLVLETMEKIFHFEGCFKAKNLVEGDNRAIAAYFCCFLMAAYKFRQQQMVVLRLEQLKAQTRDAYTDIEFLCEQGLGDSVEKEKLDKLIQAFQAEKAAIESRFNVAECRDNLNFAQDTLKEMQGKIRDKLKDRFEIVQAPRDMTLNQMCISLMINLSLSNGAAFCKLLDPELILENRRIVLQSKKNGEFYDDFTRKTEVTVRQMLRQPSRDSILLDPAEHPQFDIYVECQSKNSLIGVGESVLYQVFPGTLEIWQNGLLKHAKEGNYHAIQKLITFFSFVPDFINYREPGSLNTALHYACRYGQLRVALQLLQNFADIDARNVHKCTPLFLAVESGNRRVCQLLIEWGCDIHAKNIQKLTALEASKSDELRRNLMRHYQYYSTTVPLVVSGQLQHLSDMIEDHVTKRHELVSIQSRCLNGSTLLHTAAYFDHLLLIRRLLKLKIDVSIRDYKGAGVLHRAGSVLGARILLEAGADVQLRDREGNQALHVKCFGEDGKQSQLDLIRFLLDNDASPTSKNDKDLMPIHCAALQGRTDVINLLLTHDASVGGGAILRSLGQESSTHPPSLVCLSLTGGFVECADWLLGKGFDLKQDEASRMLYKLVSGELQIARRFLTLGFLLDKCGADPSAQFPPDGATALHLAAGLSEGSDMMLLLLDKGGCPDARAGDMATPLFYACRSGNQLSASLLIERGADTKCRAQNGLAAFDHITDFDEWLTCGYFSDQVCARIRAYQLKRTRDSIRGLLRRVKPNSAKASTAEVIAANLSVTLANELPPLVSGSGGGGGRPLLHRARTTMMLPPAGTRLAASGVLT
ncbi:hypothetical protein BOX15_Mlig030254g2 [Macrostomum lignano]|uniref:Uncharacterized protein n=1 Tax=Macrostomum lignano TaxID=282301 RepID=A0A267E2G1_9PLAT|nr:hypothetical protein BOX15_Mlig030254g2 [Macrostomum lignano]